MAAEDYIMSEQVGGGRFSRGLRLLQDKLRNRQAADDGDAGDSAQPVEAGESVRAQELQQMDGIHTDHKLISFYYRNFRGNSEALAVATDSFIDKSKDEYNAAWLSRELIQNFVDHNPEHPGTLDGVVISRKELKDGLVHYQITGEWPFEDPTGIISPHSEKPTEQKTAGGNGIGLKQAAIRLLRDFGVKKFEIQGEGWEANYELAQAQEINQALEQTYATLGLPVDRTMKHDWLVAKLDQTDKSGSVSYTIETDNPEVIAALDQLQDLGVSEQNRFLQNPDFANEHGVIKWLLPTNEDTPISYPRGRLFINGQVMNFEEKGDTADNYWVGPQYVTVQLNDVDYKMSIDRPPVGFYDLNRYLYDLVHSMSVDELVGQLQKSEPIWSNPGAKTSGGGSLPVITYLVFSLRSRSDYDKSDFIKYFPDKKYLARDTRLTADQEKNFAEQGFILCPDDFALIGMPKASSELSTFEAAVTQSPNSSQVFSQAEKSAEEVGVSVTYEDLSTLEPEALLPYLNENLSSLGAQPFFSYRKDKPLTLRIILDLEIPKALLSRSLSKPKTNEQKALNLVRGTAFYGLQKGIFKSVYLAQGEYVSNFSSAYDSALGEQALCAKNVEASSPGPWFECELNEQYASLLTDQIVTGEQVNPKAAGPIETPSTAAKPKVSAPAEPHITGPKPEATLVAAPGSADEQQTNPKTAGPIETPSTDTKPNANTPAEPSVSDSEPGDGAPTSGVDGPIMIKGGAVKTTETTGVTGTDTRTTPPPRVKPEETAVRQPRVIKKDVPLSISPEELDVLEKVIPGIREAVEKLDDVGKGRQVADGDSAETLMGKYIKWSDSNRAVEVAEENAGYVSGRDLADILNAHNQADIAVVKGKLQADDHEVEALSEAVILQKRLEAAIERLSPEGPIDDFEFIFEPTEKQLAQLGLLRMYANLTTGAGVPNSLFVYAGTGSKGINIRKEAIGLHEEVLKQNFWEANGIFTHELAHNKEMDHDPGFMHMMQALFLEASKKITAIAQKSSAGEALSKEEEAILGMSEHWDKLRQD
jgi:hypothetical protein